MKVINRLQAAYKGFTSPTASNSLPRNFAYLDDKQAASIDSIMRSVPMPVRRWWSFFNFNDNYRPNESLDKYGENVWLYSAITLIAQEVARVPFYIKRMDDEGDFEPVKRHQCLSTLKFPLGVGNRRAHLTGKLLEITTYQHLLLNGEAYWVLDKRLPVDLGGSPMAILPLIPGGVKKVLDRDNMIEAYEYETPNAKWTFPAEDVVHFKLPNPADWFAGHSPIKSAWTSLETYGKAERLAYHKIDNMAIPAGLLKTEKAVPQKERMKILEEFLEEFQGAENASKTGILPYGLGFEKIQESMKDLQAVEGQEQRRDEILGNYRIGKGLLGLTEDQSRANAEAQNYVFQRFNALPFIELIAEILSVQYAPAFAGITPGVDEIGFDDPVPENMEDKRSNIDTMAKNGAITPDEIRQAFGYDELNKPGITDIPYMPMNMVPLGEEPEEPEPPPAPFQEPPEDEEEESDEGDE